MKHSTKKFMGFLFALAVIFAGIFSTEAQAAAAKPVISSSQTTISGNSCTITRGGVK